MAKSKFSMTKDELVQRDEIAEKLRSAFSELERGVIDFNESVGSANEKLEGAVDEYNGALEDARSTFQDKVDEYNTILEEARQFAEDIASQGESVISERSEKWQEGDRGQAAQAWVDTLREADFDDIQIDLPDDIGIDFPGELSVEEIEDHGQMMEDLPEEADEV